MDRSPSWSAAESRLGAVTPDQSGTWASRPGFEELVEEIGGGLGDVATHGYPLPIVEHLRIRSGDGVLGRVYASGKPVVADAPSDGSRRLRYRTDSYMALPVIDAAILLP